MITDHLIAGSKPFTTTATQSTPLVALPTFSSPARLLFCGLGLGAMFDVLFYGRMLGISVLLFVAAIIGVLQWVSRMEDRRPMWRNLGVLVPLFFFAAMVFVRANPFVTFLNLCAVVGLLGLIAYFFSAGHLSKLGIIGYALAFTVAGLHALILPIFLLLKSLQGKRTARMNGGRLLPILRGVLLALPVLLVFAVLLASADLVFANLLAAILNLNLLPNADELIWQFGVVCAVGWVLAGGLAFAVGRGQSASASDVEAWDEPMSKIPSFLHIGFVEVTTLLVLVNGLFLAFGAVQFAYLFGGESNVGAAGYTYADYARRGFFELIAVSVLTLALILGLHHLARRDTARQRFFFNLLGSLMVVLVLMLLASAYRRMSLYEDAYGYTELRLYVQIFEVWLAVTLVWLGAVLWLPARNFAIGGFIAAICFLATVNLSNPDATIAHENLDRYRTSGVLDVSYLSSLSEDAVPTLLPALDFVKGAEHEELAAGLTTRLQQMEQDASWRAWQSSHISRSEAYNILRSTFRVPTLK